MSESTVESITKNTRGNNPLQPFMGEIFQKVIKPKITYAFNEVKTEVELKREEGDDKATVTIGLICKKFNELNAGSNVSDSTFSKWMKECGFKSQRVTTIEPTA